MASWLGTTGSEPFIEEPAVVTTALDEALATDYDGTLRIAPAWPFSTTHATTISATTANTFTLHAAAGHSYLVEPTANPTTALLFSRITGTPATTARHLGGRVIGLDPTTTSGSPAT